MHRLKLLVLLAACVLGVASLSRAEEKPKTSSLSWVRLGGAEDCIATQTLARAVEERLGRAVFVSAANADLSVEGRVERREESYVAHIEVRDASGKLLGTRDLESKESSCDALREPLALALAVMIDPEAALAPKPTTSAPPPPPIASSAPSPTPTAIPSPPPTARRGSPHIEAFAGPSLSFGLVPDVGLGVSVGGLAAGRPLLGGKVGVTYVVETATPVPGGASVRLSVLLASVSYCPLSARNARVSFVVCGGAVGGIYFVRGVGFAVSRSDVRPTVGASIDARAGLRVAGPLTLSVGVGALFLFARDDIDYRDADGNLQLAFRASPVAFAADMSAGVRFP